MRRPSDIIRKTAREHDLHPSAEARALAPYQAWNKSATETREASEAPELTERERLAVSLVALGSQERMLVLEMLAAAPHPRERFRRCCTTRRRWSKARAPTGV